MDVLQLLHHPDYGRAHLEADDALLHPPDHRRDHTHLSRSLPRGGGDDRTLRCTADPVQSRADELLLRFPHPVHHHWLPCRSSPRESSSWLHHRLAGDPLLWAYRHRYQWIKPLPHLRVWAGNHPWRKRTEAPAERRRTASTSDSRRA